MERYLSFIRNFAEYGTQQRCLSCSVRAQKTITIPPRPVWLVNMRSPLGNQVLLREVRSEYEYAQAGYAALGDGSRFRIALRREGESIATAYGTFR